MSNDASQFPALTIGLDVGDRTTQLCAVDAGGQCIAERTIATSRAGLRALAAYAPCRVVLEVGTHSPWMTRELVALGHEVVVANGSAMFSGRRRRRRNDRIDARFLARQGRADVALLHPIRHRSAVAQEHLAVIRARDQFVQTRTKLINHVRGAVKVTGHRLRACSAEAFAKRAALELPAALVPALTPMLDMLTAVSRQIAAYDRQIADLIATAYPVARRLQQPQGVGPLTALTFVLLVDDPTRFPRSRDVGAYFGLVPRLDESGTATPQLRITKSGDGLGRRLLVSAAQYIMGPFGPPCNLRRHGEGIAARGGANAKKRAVVAVARKLAVLLHHLWVTNGIYDPDYRHRQAA